jgi:hypothetical protein
MSRIVPALWILCVCAGLGGLLVYGNTPGAPAASPEAWPADPAGAELETDHPTLIMFAHPRCPCTRSSLHELERLVAQVGGRIRGRILFQRPSDAEEGWERTELWRIAEAIPGFRAEVDPDGRAARAFGAETSGHVVVYDPDGRLIFSGGVTAARAHEGDNRGRDAIRHWATTGEVTESRTRVFGCALRDAGEDGEAAEDA